MMQNGSTGVQRVHVAIVGESSPGNGQCRALLAADADLDLTAGYACVSDLPPESSAQYPEMVFLDECNPSKDDLEILRLAVEQKRLDVVFIMSDDHLALQAIRCGALDYLVKPVEQERFRECLHWGKKRIMQRQQEGDLLRKLTTLLAQADARRHQMDHMLIKRGAHMSILKPEDIEWIEAEGDYVRLHAAGKWHLVREKIGSLETQLPPEKFVRIHRSAIVNIDRIKELQPLMYGECAVILNNGTRLTLSRSYRERVFHRFAHFC